MLVLIRKCLIDVHDGNQFRDFIHVNDVVAAILQAIKNSKAKGEI